MSVTRVGGLLLALASFAVITTIFVMSLGRPVLGVDAHLRQGTWLVGYVNPVGLAYQSGVKSGAKVISVNGEPVHQFAQGARYIAWRRISEITVVTGEGAELHISTRGAQLPQPALWELLRLWVISTVFWASGAFLAARGQQTGGARALFLFCQAVALFIATVPGAARDMPATRELATAAVTLIPALFVHFCLLFPERKHALDRHPKLHALPYLPATVLFAISVLVARADEAFFLLQFRPVLLLNLAVGILIGDGVLTYSYINAATLRAREQVRVIVGAALVGVLPFVLLSALPEAVFGRTIVLPSFSVLAAGFIPIGMVSSVAGRQLMGVDRHIRRGLIYGSLILIAVAAYAATIFLVSTALKDVSLQAAIAAVAVLSVLASLAFRPAKELVQRLVDRSLYSDFQEHKQALADISEALSSVDGVKPLSFSLAESILSTFGLSAACVLLYDDKGRLSASAVVGEYAQSTQELKRAIAMAHQTMAQESTATALAAVASQEPLCLPLNGQKATLGFLCVEAGGFAQRLSEIDASLLIAVASSAGLALEQAVLLEQVKGRYEELRLARQELGQFATLVRDVNRTLQEMQKGIPLALVMGLEILDPYERQHSARVAVLTRDIAGKLGLSNTETAILELACRIHHVGEKRVRYHDALEAIGLALPGLLRRHEGAQQGGVLPSLATFEQHCIAILESQHEHYDGTGPLGKKGEEIPLGARLLAVVDAYDTLVYPHPHSEASGKEKAQHKLFQGAFTRWDPKAVVACLQYLDSLG